MANLSKEKRERMLEFLAQLRKEHTDDSSIIAINEIENELTSKKYGLVWEEHSEEVDEKMITHIPVFTEVKDKEILSDKNMPFNFLLEGDNLHSLKLLEKTHKGKIDLIYIDPPYNTGKDDFIYNDKKIGEEDCFRHSKWLSFMYERLRIAKNLLSEEGTIFIQISDIEISQLKLLCDEIFGEENFLNIVNVNMKNIAGASGGGEDKRFKKNCEYILVYAKNYDTLPIFNGAYELSRMSELVRQYKDEGKSWKYNSVLVDRGQKEYIDSTVDGDGNEIRIYKRIGLKAISIKQYAKQNSISEDDVFDFHSDIVFRTTMPQSSIRPRVINKMKELNRAEDVISIEYIPKTGRNKGKVYEQFYSGNKYNLFAWLSDVTEIINGVAYKKDLQGTYWNMVSETKNLSKEGNVEFKNGKKPVKLLKQIISMYPYKNATILDFFAGSGTTGHAVISQNIEDGGNRTFILCTNNENNICEEKTYKRLSNVINGYTTESGKVFQANHANLKYFKTDFVAKNNCEDTTISDNLINHIKEMVELENGIEIDNSRYILILTDEDADSLTEELLKNCENIYVSSSVLLTTKEEMLFKKMGINIFTIPDYYFENELREVGER